MKQSISDKTLIQIPGGQASCKYAFFPGYELCAFFPEQVIFSYEAIVQQMPDTAIFIAAGNVDLKYYWQSIGCPVVIFASESDMLAFSRAVPEAQTISIYEKFTEWNIFGGCVHDGFYSSENSPASKAAKSLLKTMGAVINDDSNDNLHNLPVLTCDMHKRNTLLAKGQDVYFALELFFDTEPEDEGSHSHEHQQKQLRLPEECRASLCTDAEQQQNISEVCEVINNLFF